MFIHGMDEKIKIGIYGKEISFRQVKILEAISEEVSALKAYQLF